MAPQWELSARLVWAGKEPPSMAGSRTARIFADAGPAASARFAGGSIFALGHDEHVGDVVLLAGPVGAGFGFRSIPLSLRLLVGDGELHARQRDSGAAGFDVQAVILEVEGEGFD